jgi:hypothetical protein
MLIFIGLFTQADKAGRFRWNVRQLKLDLLPFIEYDLEAALNSLREGGFITEYSVDGMIYGLIRGFGKHQYTTGREPESKLPPPPGQSGSLTDTCSVHARACTKRAEERIFSHTGSESGSGSGSGSESYKAICSSLSAYPTPRRLEPEDGSSALLLAKEVEKRCHLFTGKAHESILKACEVEILSGKSTSAIAEEMASSWKEYRAAGNKLDFPYGPDRFFGEGLYRDKGAWRYKDGYAPRVPRQYYVASEAQL